MTNNGETDQRTSRYLDYLPAIYQADPEVPGSSFLGRFLLAFEHLLTGLGKVDEPGLEEIVQGVAAETGEPIPPGLERYFSPRSPASPTRRSSDEEPNSKLPIADPAEFLPWLAGWVALALHPELEPRWPELIEKAVLLYQSRGTKQGLNDSLELALQNRLGSSASIIIDEPAEPAHFFRVTIRVSGEDQAASVRRIAEFVIQSQKPAHTNYELVIEVQLDADR